MNIYRTAATIARLLLTIVLIASPLSAQRRRAPAPKPPPSVQPAQPAPTFDTALAAGSYRIYGEVRGLGQLLRSSDVNDLLDPAIKLVTPPKEFKALVKWLDSQADALMSSRLLFAASPARPKLPQALMIIEFPSAEDAQKFEPQLKRFLPKLLPTPTPTPTPTPDSSAITSSEKTAPAKTNQEDSFLTSPSAPQLVLKQAGSLIFVSDTAVTFKDLRPTGSKSLAEDQNFRQVHDRFSSDSIFFFIDIASFEKEDQERRRVWEEEERKRREQEAANRQKAVEEEILTPDEMAPGSQVEAPPPRVVDPSGQSATDVVVSVSSSGQTEVEISSGTIVGQQPPKAFSPSMLSMLSGALFSGPPKWPEAIGVALNFEPDSYVVRALLLSRPDDKGNLIPFIPQLIAGPPVTPEASSILPADTELLLTASLDYPQMYDALTKNLMREYEISVRSAPPPVKDYQPESPFAAYEAKLGIKIKDDLLPLLGNEIALSLPLKALGLASAESSPAPAPETPSKEGSEQASSPQPVVAVSVRDKEALRALLPRIIDSIGFKGASMLAQTEKRGDTELVSYLGVVSYAFIGNFLVLSPDSKSVRHVVDSYLNHQTLGSDSRFRNAMRWQPRQVLGQVYMPTELMESYYQLLSNSSGNDKLRDFVSRLNPSAEPVTYALSNEGFGSLHELHLPKNLVMFMIAGMTSGIDRPPEAANEAFAMSALRMIATAQISYQSDAGNGSFATLDQLMERGLMPKEMMEKYGYKIELSVTGSKFEASAVPLEYGKTGKMSFFIDESLVLRGADNGGAPATVADKPVQ